MDNKCMARTKPGVPPLKLNAVEVRRREIAARLGCFTEGEVAELTGYALGSLETYRRRHVGLPWIRVGPEVLYPIEPVRKLLHARIQHPREVADTL
jgi:hypothetical protein